MNLSIQLRDLGYLEVSSALQPMPTIRAIAVVSNRELDWVDAR
jgi:hypothetical protein